MFFFSTCGSRTTPPMNSYLCKSQTCLCILILAVSWYTRSVHLLISRARRSEAGGIFTAVSAVGLYGVGRIPFCVVPRQNEEHPELPGVFIAAGGGEGRRTLW